MNNNLVSYEVAESPKKTTGVIVGVTLVVLGIGAVVLYFVGKRKADKPLGNQAELDLIREIEQGDGNVSTLLDKLSNFGLNKVNPSSYTASTSSIGTSTASGATWVQVYRSETQDKIQDAITPTTKIKMSSNS